MSHAARYIFVKTLLKSFRKKIPNGMAPTSAVMQSFPIRDHQLLAAGRTVHRSLSAAADIAKYPIHAPISG